MNNRPLFTASQLDLLLRGRSISSEHPWCTNDRALIEAHYRAICDDIVGATGVSLEIYHHTHVYTSYVDALFYRPTSDFTPRRRVPSRQGYAGLAVLLSLLSPYFVFMEVDRHWDSAGCGGGSFPAREEVDRMLSPGPVALAKEVQPLLERNGLRRLFHDDLTTLLPPALKWVSLALPPFTEFDALFCIID